MHELVIKCESCGKTYPPNQTIFRCESCKASLEISFDYPKLRKTLSLEKLRKRPFNHARYLEFYPVKNLVSLGEGGTPLIRSRNLERDLGLGFELWFKYEAQNPSGSFKDRGSSVEVSRALQAQSGGKTTRKYSYAAKRVVVASTGNMGASLSAYSALAKLDCHVFTPSDARPVKLRQILAYGAKVYEIPGDYTQAASLVEQASQRFGIYLLGDYLIRREGTKSVGFEIAEQLPGVDFVISPMGNGTLISATWKAFKEWKTLGFSRGLPKMIGVQASGCPPVVKAFKSGRPIKPVKGKTIAVAIECGDPLDGSRALSAIKESRGFAEAVSDREILRARELLARREGLFAEPAGAVGLAGLIKTRKQIPRGLRVVCLITGHGLKTPYTPIGGKMIKLSKGSSLKGIFS
jgi:threonine synthase